MSLEGKKDAVSRWETVDVEHITDCRIYRLERVHRRSPLNGEVVGFCRIASPDWVNVVAVTEERQMVLVRQYRQGIDDISLEIPGGIVDEGEGPLETARRELREETGYDADSFRIIGRVHANPALFDNWNYTVLAEGARLVSDPDPDEHEEIVTQLFPIDEVERLVREGAITHSLVIDGLYWYRLLGENGKNSDNDTDEQQALEA